MEFSYAPNDPNPENAWPVMLNDFSDEAPAEPVTAEETPAEPQPGQAASEATPQAE